MNFANRMQIIQKIIQSEELLTAYCAATNMPMVDCSSETFNDQAFAFENEEVMKSFIKPYIDQRWLLRGVIFKKKDKMRFFATLVSANVDELVYVRENEVDVIKMSELVRKKDVSKIPEPARPVENPQLKLSGMYFAQEASRQVPMEQKTALKDLEEELSANVVKGVYLLPVGMQPADNPVPGQQQAGAPVSDQQQTGFPEPGQQPKSGTAQINDQVLPKNIQFRIPLVKDPKGNMLQPIFTDNIELSTFVKNGKVNVIKVPFANLEKLLAKEASGYILNPNGFHLNITPAMLKNLKDRFGKS